MDLGRRFSLDLRAPLGCKYFFQQNNWSDKNIIKSRFLVIVINCVYYFLQFFVRRILRRLIRGWKNASISTLMSLMGRVATNTNSKEIFDFYGKQQRKLKKIRKDSSTKNGQMYAHSSCQSYGKYVFKPGFFNNYSRCQ